MLCCYRNTDCWIKSVIISKAFCFSATATSCSQTLSLFLGARRAASPSLQEPGSPEHPHGHIPFELGSFHEYCVLRFVHVVAAAGVSLRLWAEFTHVRAGPHHVHLAGCAGGHACVFQHVEGCALPSPECVPCWGLLSVGTAVRLRVSCVLVGHHHLFLSVAYRVFC